MLALRVQALLKVICTSFSGKYNLTIEIANHQAVNYFQIAEAPVFDKNVLYTETCANKSRCLGVNPVLWELCR